MPSKREQYLRDKQAFEDMQEEMLAKSDKMNPGQNRKSFGKVPYDEYQARQKEAAEPGIMDQLGQMWNDAFSNTEKTPRKEGASDQYTDQLNKIKQRNEAPKPNRFDSTPQPITMNEEEEDEENPNRPLNRGLLSKMKMPVA